MTSSFGRRADVDRHLDFEQSAPVRLAPALDGAQRLPLRNLCVALDDQRIAMKLAELARIVTAKIDEEQTRALSGGASVVTVTSKPSASSTAPAIEVQRFGIGPSLQAKIIAAGLDRLADREADVMQLSIGAAYAAADLDHEKLHRRKWPRRSGRRSFYSG